MKIFPMAKIAEIAVSVEWVPFGQVDPKKVQQLIDGISVASTSSTMVGSGRPATRPSSPPLFSAPMPLLKQATQSSAAARPLAPQPFATPTSSGLGGATAPSPRPGSPPLSGAHLPSHRPTARPLVTTAPPGSSPFAIPMPPSASTIAATQKKHIADFVESTLTNIQTIMAGGPDVYLRWVAEELTRLAPNNVPIIPIVSTKPKSSLWLTGLASQHLPLVPFAIGIPIDVPYSTRQKIPAELPIPEEYNLIYIDDATYSGTQAEILIKNINLTNLKPINFFMFFAGASQSAIARILNQDRRPGSFQDLQKHSAADAYSTTSYGKYPKPTIRPHHVASSPISRIMPPSSPAEPEPSSPAVVTVDTPLVVSSSSAPPPLAMPPRPIGTGEASSSTATASPNSGQIGNLKISIHAQETLRKLATPAILGTIQRNNHDYNQHFEADPATNRPVPIRGSNAAGRLPFQDVYNAMLTYKIPDSLSAPTHLYLGMGAIPLIQNTIFSTIGKVDYRQKFMPLCMPASALSSWGPTPVPLSTAAAPVPIEPQPTGPLASLSSTPATAPLPPPNGEGR